MKEGFIGERSIVLPKGAIELEERDQLTRSLYITDIGYYPNAESHLVKRERGIDQHVLIYCVNGSGFCRVGQDRFDINANEYCILPAYKPHQYGANEDSPWTIYWIHFKGEHADIYAEGASRPQKVHPSINSRISERHNFFEELFFTLAEGYSMENLRYVSSLMHYYLASLRYLNQYRAAGRERKGGGDVDSSYMVSAAIHFMKENLEKHLTLKSLSDYTGYSPSHFSAVFKHTTGLSPMAYLNMLRVQLAQEWLKDTNMKINQICYKIGIDDQYYFSRVFSKQTGMSPREYRRQNRQ